MYLYDITFFHPKFPVVAHQYRLQLPLPPLRSHPFSHVSSVSLVPALAGRNKLGFFLFLPTIPLISQALRTRPTLRSDRSPLSAHRWKRCAYEAPLLWSGSKVRVLGLFPFFFLFFWSFLVLPLEVRVLVFFFIVIGASSWGTNSWPSRCFSSIVLGASSWELWQENILFGFDHRLCFSRSYLEILVSDLGFRSVFLHDFYVFLISPDQSFEGENNISMLGIL